MKTFLLVLAMLCLTSCSGEPFTLQLPQLDSGPWSFEHPVIVEPTYDAMSPFKPTIDASKDSIVDASPDKDLDRPDTDSSCYIPKLANTKCEGYLGPHIGPPCIASTEFCVVPPSTSSMPPSVCAPLPDNCKCVSSVNAICDCLEQNFKCTAGLRMICLYDSNTTPIVRCI